MAGFVPWLLVRLCLVLKLAITTIFSKISSSMAAAANQGSNQTSAAGYAWSGLEMGG